MYVEASKGGKDYFSTEKVLFSQLSPKAFKGSLKVDGKSLKYQSVDFIPKAVPALENVSEGTSSLRPHSPQNLKLGGLDELQLGQSLSNLAPHSPQNLIPCGFSN